MARGRRRPTGRAPARAEAGGVAKVPLYMASHWGGRDAEAEPSSERVVSPDEVRGLTDRIVRRLGRGGRGTFVPRRRLGQRP